MVTFAVRAICACAAGVVFAVILISPFAVVAAKADPLETPQFRPGLWTFQRTVERVREAPQLNQLIVSEEMTRCVNPTLAMKHIFASPPIGNCTSTKPERIDNKYVFANRCDAMGPVRTEITVDSDVSYKEVNELKVGALPRLDIVVARRVGECDAVAGYQPSTTSDGFQLSSATSRPARKR
jgi:Protein of unknown function (DUF3617)